MGAGRLRQVEAEFKLSAGPILILVDDLDERLTWAPTREFIAEELAKQLLEHGATQKVISPETVQKVRRTEPDFDQLKCTQVGRLVGADQVLWIEVQSFLAEEAVEEVGQAAALVVTVKIVNPNERQDRAKVRLWPGDRAGQPLAVQLNSGEVTRLKTKDRIAGELAGKLAQEAAKLFYKHPMEEEE